MVHAWPVSTTTSTPFANVVYKLIAVRVDDSQETENLFLPQSSQVVRAKEGVPRGGDWLVTQRHLIDVSR